MLVKILGIIDIIAGLMLIFNIYNVFWMITAFFAGVLIIKGLTGIITDFMAMIMGVADILVALFIIFGPGGFLIVKLILFAIMMIKGASSLV
jgi:hypothetical protein